jgi:hypothetical protein
MMPLATTTYTIKRATNLTGDSAEALNFEVVYTGVEGSTVYLSGSESLIGGDRERVDGRILLDPGFDVHHADQVVDELTGDAWDVSFVRHRTGLDLDHQVLGVYAITGTARGSRDL